MTTLLQASFHVLVIDDDPTVLTVLGALLHQAAIEVSLADGVERGLELLAARPIDAVITDLRMPGGGGMEVLARVSRRWPHVPVVLLTAHGSVPAAVSAMRHGAADFVEKPFEHRELLQAVHRALARSRAVRPPPDATLVGASNVMGELRHVVSRAARGTATVLVRGETGTGKELVARMIHQQSARGHRPFVRVHCGALPDALLESELFGHEAGAFTGAVRMKPGRVELAEGGTLFLDEIGDVTPAFQIKLLNLLQEREFSRLGGTETRKANVRFVAATHQNLEAMVALGEFREDLYYRLHVLDVWCPPLRERKGDIEGLVARFAEEVSVASGRAVVTFTKEALELLVAERWPGNVRQLRNFVERIIALSDCSELGAPDVACELDRSGHDASGPAPASERHGPPRLEVRRRAAEKKALVQALEQAKGNRALAARILGISRRTLYNKLEREGLV